MDLVPPYLAAYLWQIRKHSGEVGYIETRLDGKGFERAAYEKSMLTELANLRLIALSDDQKELVFDPLNVEVMPGLTVTQTGSERSVNVPVAFIVLAR